MGRNLTHQAQTAQSYVLFFDRPLNRFMGSGANSVVIRDLDGDNFDHGEVDFIGGAYIIGAGLRLSPNRQLRVSAALCKSDLGIAVEKSGSGSLRPDCESSS